MLSKVMRSVRLKQLVPGLPGALGIDAKAYRKFEVPRSILYRQKNTYAEQAIAGLVRKKAITNNHPRQPRPEVVDKIFHLRQKDHFAPRRIAWNLERYHRVTMSCFSIYRTLVCHYLRRLPRWANRQ